MALGTSKDISLFGLDLTGSSPAVDTSLLATFGYIRFDVGGGGTTGEGLYISDHAARSLALLIEQFKKDKPIINGTVNASVSEAQVTEDTLYDMQRFRSIETASGRQLDLIGDIVGVSRTSADDEVYRADIYFGIFLNSSNGEPETLIAALQQITKAAVIDYAEEYPAAVILTMNGVSGAIPADVMEKLRRLKPAGVRIDLRLNNTETPFIFDGEGGFPPYFVGEGFGETGALWTEVGGNFTELIT